MTQPSSPTPPPVRPRNGGFRMWHIPAILAVLFALAWIAVLFSPILFQVGLDSKTGELGYAVVASVFAMLWIHPN